MPEIFSTDIPAELSTIPLSNEPIDEGDLLLLLQSLEPEKAEEATEELTVAPTAAVAKVHTPAPPPGDWNMALSDLGDLCGLQGMEEPATRALAALAAGVHVILTGPPGSGKTKLAECICAKAGFPTWTVPATDQWTTFETIGGYFPTPKEGESGDRLDFLPGAVVDSIERGHCLIIDEINRADIDKAFGELFTLLSSNTVTLPYRRRSDDGRFRRVRLQVGSAVIEDKDADVIVVPAWWRIVGSMNDADKARRSLGNVYALLVVAEDFVADRGGERAAIMYTLIQTARLNSVDPQAWLADVLARINDHAIHRLDELLPWNWTGKPARLAA